MSTTTAEREAARALMRVNLTRFVEQVNANRSDLSKTNLSLSIASLQVISVINLAETLEAQGSPSQP